MRVELVAVGTELLLGDVVNTNAAWLGRRLAEVGIDVARSVVVGDNVERIAAAVTRPLRDGSADAVLVTGGLGPTQDDLTREGLAAAAGVGIRRVPALEQRLLARSRSPSTDLDGWSARQADLPTGAEPIENFHGSAPGVRLVLPGGGVVYALPGVPHEMEAMFLGGVLPVLVRAAGSPAVLVSRVLRLAGVEESAVAEGLAAEVGRLEGAGNPTIAFLAGGGEVQLRLTAKAADRAAAMALLEPVERATRAALGDAVYGVDEESLAAVVLRLLRERRSTLATAESLTGGGLGAALTAPVGASESYLGGIVAYATRQKSDLLGVPAAMLAEQGAVAADVARAMADGVRERLAATYGLALTGVAGPDGQDGQPVGTVFVGLCGPDGAQALGLRVPGDRARVRAYSVVAALDLLRRRLQMVSAVPQP